MKKIALMIAALAFLTVSSCKKEDEKKTTTPAKSKTELLTAKAWKTTAMTINPGIAIIPGGPVITDLFAFFDPCEKDDTEKFGRYLGIVFLDNTDINQTLISEGHATEYFGGKR